MLEDSSLHQPGHQIPRASLILAAGEAGNPFTEVWMGGAHSHVGEEFSHKALSLSWVIDCAGEIEVSYREATGRWIACVFPDLDGPLASSNRVHETVRTVLESIRVGDSQAPERLYVMCQHGMNRSGLVAGLILRGLGVPARETVDRIRAARPGALANDHFRLMLMAD